MTNPYVYKMINTDTKQFYIGCRFTEGCDPQEGFDVYASSSRIVKHMILDNPSQWQKQILLEGDSELVRLEEQTLIKLNRDDPLCLNGCGSGYKKLTKKKPHDLSQVDDETINEYTKQLGQRIREARKNKEVNSVDFAKHVGISRVSLHRIESGYTNITADMLLKTLKALDMLEM
jgi:DNA-binding XRE family transcriptional regulator